ncbi:uncharacterized protein PgNI_04464, partial [Pyricularia grisea]|uniref:Uncharacterized protein n=1 Tax=Pyricularia grisea TaxID=148305 RepID=A0A6P8BAU0_PYRGI
YVAQRRRIKPGVTDTTYLREHFYRVEPVARPSATYWLRRDCLPAEEMHVGPAARTKLRPRVPSCRLF